MGSMEPRKLFGELDKLCLAGFRSYSGDFDQFLTSKIAVSGQSLKTRVEKTISKISLDTAVVVGICLGNNKTMEKQDPRQVADNIALIYSHMKELVGIE